MKKISDKHTDSYPFSIMRQHKIITIFKKSKLKFSNYGFKIVKTCSTLRINPSISRFFLKSCTTLTKKKKQNVFECTN